MLKVGLTGGLGSGKSTVAEIFHSLGAHIFYADEIGRALMQPGQPVFTEIVRRFGPSVVAASGELDRPALARAAFENNRIDELNRVIHPAVIAEEERLLAELGQSNPHAVGIVESALIFEASKAGTDLGFTTNLSITPAWLDRFDKIILVIAPEDLRVQRFVDRMLQIGPRRPDAAALAAADARRRMSHQLPDAAKLPYADYVISNDGPLAQLESQVTAIYNELRSLA